MATRQNQGEQVPAQHLLVVDPAVFEGAESRVVRNFVDRLSAIRRDTIFTLLGAGIPDGLVLPQPDYLICDGGARIVRQPRGEEVAGWPDGKAPTEVDAAHHLAERLMVPVNEVYVVAGPGHEELLEATDKAVAIGLPDPKGALGRVTSQGINRALEELQLFFRPARRISDLCDEAFDRAVESVRRNITDSGFTAASVKDNALRPHDANYAAVWSRDGILTGLWTLCLNDDELTMCFKRTLETLAHEQSPTGQIPANVRLSGEVEYCGLGGIASIDAVIWFVIGHARYAFATNDRDFANSLLGNAERAMSWLAAHDSNNDGLLEIPEASDWMDLFPRSYNVLYDEVLWYQACLDHAAVLDALGHDGSGWRRHSETVRRRILETFWPTGKHLEEMTASGHVQGTVSGGPFLLCNITPFDYSWRCDVYANLLAALTDLLDEDKSELLFQFLWGVGVNSPYPVACLYPAVQSGADDWKDYFIVNFLNLPHHYHNGGIWPFVGGLWIRFLYHMGRRELAHRELAALAQACQVGMRGTWEFNEWLHGLTGRPMGKAHQAWSAASFIAAYTTLTEETVPAAFAPLDPRNL